MRTAVVIDDDPQFAALLARLLSPDFEVRLAGGTEEGLAACRDPGAGVVLLDVCLPDGDGLALVERLAADPRTALLPVIALTAARIDARLRRAFARHASVRGLLDKVAPPARLLEAVRRAAGD